MWKFGQHLLTKNVKIWLEAEKLLQKSLFPTMWTKWWGFSTIWVLRVWYLLKNTSKGCNFNQIKPYNHILNIHEKIFFRKFGIFSFFSYFYTSFYVYFFTIKVLQKRNAKIHPLFVCFESFSLLWKQQVLNRLCLSLLPQWWNAFKINKNEVNVRSTFLKYFYSKTIYIKWCVKIAEKWKNVKFSKKHFFMNFQDMII